MPDEILLERLRFYIDYITTAKTHNTVQWMRTLQCRTNTLLEALGDTDRVRFNGVGFEIERGEPCQQ